jgi:hypothetical protein
MQDFVAPVSKAIAALVRGQHLALAVVVGFFFGVMLRQLLFVLWVDRGRNVIIVLLRLLAALLFGGVGVLLCKALGPAQPWDGPAVLAAAAGAVSVLFEVCVLGVRQLRPGRTPLLGWLVRLILILAALLVAAVGLMRAGYLALSTDAPVLRIEVTGETGERQVHWAPPDQPMQQQTLRTSRVVFRSPTGQKLAEAWLYGDQVGISGRVLRLSPRLNALGMPNLFALDFVHNGYTTADRHNRLPHQAVPLPAVGQLAVHPRWRALQDELLARWEQRAPKQDDSPWLLRTATTESTYFPLVSPDGQPLRQTYTLVLTPGGLTAQ